MEDSDNESSTRGDTTHPLEVDYFSFRAPSPRLPTGITAPEERERPRRVRQTGRVITLFFGFLCVLVITLAVRAHLAPDGQWGARYARAAIAT